MPELHNLTILGDILANDPCGVFCHKSDLDYLRIDRYSKSSASADMCLPVLVRILGVMIDRYPPAEKCNSRARYERERIEEARRLLAEANESYGK